MVVSVSAPQEIIDAIVDELGDDILTLAHCAVVSPAFLSASRRHLFRAVHIHNSDSCRRLFRILTANPHIAPYVRTLRISAHAAGELWPVTEDTFPPLLRTMRRLQSVSLGCTGGSLDWDKLTPELQSALLDLFGSPHLADITLRHVHNAPFSHINKCTQLKRLGLHYVSGSEFRTLTRPSKVVSLDSPTSHTAPGQLVTLELGGTSDGGTTDATSFLFQVAMNPQSLLDITRLRELVIRGKHSETLNLAIGVIKAAAQSLEFFAWTLDRRDLSSTGPFEPGPVNLRNMPKLRSLLLETTYLWDDEYDLLSWVVNALREGVGYIAPESVTIILNFNTWYFRSASQFVMQLCEYHVWTGLDSVLSEYPTMRAVNIFLRTSAQLREGCARLDEPVSLPSIIAEQMPLLDNGGILHVESGDYHTKQSTREHVVDDLSWGVHPRWTDDFPLCFVDRKLA